MRVNLIMLEQVRKNQISDPLAVRPINLIPFILRMVAGRKYNQVRCANSKEHFAAILCSDGRSVLLRRLFSLRGAT